MTTSHEVNFDGIVGPTHNYGGLSYGNVASVENKQAVSNPRAAALQGLEKMKFLMDLGIKQAVLPPQERPHLPTLRSLGFQGTDTQIIQEALLKAPEIYYACCSASAMWTANAATVSPSADSADHRVHFTPANLSSKFHRSIEHGTTARILHAIFANENHFVHHPALPEGNFFADEGAANHTRFCKSFDTQGVQLFCYGRTAFDNQQIAPLLFPARQTLEASQAIARRHKLDPNKVVFAQQNPRVIDAGVFHNDVISVGHQNVFFYHTQAFVDTPQVIEEIARKAEVHFIPVHEKQLSVQDAVATYLFNSQIVTLHDGTMAMIAPSECQENPITNEIITTLIRDPKNPIKQVHYFNLHESMRNGGGPACLRLRVVLTEKEIKAANPQVFLTETLYQTLTQWVKKHYRDRLKQEDLVDSRLMKESQEALDELTQILNLGSIYAFQS